MGSLTRLAGAFALALISNIAWANGDDAASQYAAGVSAFEQQRFADAAEAFQRAYKIQPNWRVLFNIGMVNAALGKPIEAVDAMERYLREGGSNVDASRQANVRAEIERQKDKIASLTVRVKPDGADVRVDGKMIGKAPVAGPVRVQAGAHVVEAALEGYRAETREVTVTGRNTADIELSLTPNATAVPSPPVSSAPPVAVAPAPPVAPPSEAQSAPEAPPSEPESGMSPLRPIGFAVLGLGVVGVGAGALMWSGARSKHDEAVTHCTPKCDSSAEELQSDAASRLKTGNVLAIIGGGVAAAGLVMVLVAPSGSRSSAVKNVTAQPWLTPGGGGVSAHARF